MKMANIVNTAKNIAKTPAFGVGIALLVGAAIVYGINKLVLKK